MVYGVWWNDGMMVQDPNDSTIRRLDDSIDQTESPRGRGAEGQTGRPEADDL